jgi:hypothetical protein
MKTVLGLLGLLSVGAFVMAGTAGCQVEAKSMTRFSGPEFNSTDSEAWSSGGTVTIDGIFGKITVKQGAADVVKADFEPFSYDGYDEKERALQDMANSMKVDVLPDGNGVLVKTWNEGKHQSSLGAQVTVELPSNFDGTLIVNNRGRGDVATRGEFDVNVGFVGNATSLDVRTGADIGDCKIQGASSVTKSEVHCGAFVQLHGVSDFVNVTTSFGAVSNDAIDVELASVSAAGGGALSSADGAIKLSMPAGAVYSVQAQTQDGAVQVNGAPAECSVEEAAPSSKTLTCGSGGPNYVVGAGDGDVVLAFH